MAKQLWDYTGCFAIPGYIKKASFMGCFFNTKENVKGEKMGENVIHIVSIMGMIGIPTIFSMTVWCIKSCRKYTKQIKILMKSQQAQMRTKLLEQFHKYESQGFITEEQLEDWENQYQAYHELGKNGILDARRDALMRLPDHL